MASRLVQDEQGSILEEISLATLNLFHQTLILRYCSAQPKKNYF